MKDNRSPRVTPEAIAECAAIVAWLKKKSTAFANHGGSYHNAAAAEIDVAAQQIERGHHRSHHHE